MYNGDLNLEPIALGISNAFNSQGWREPIDVDLNLQVHVELYQQHWDYGMETVCVVNLSPIIYTDSVKARYDVEGIAHFNKNLGLGAKNSFPKYGVKWEYKVDNYDSVKNYDKLIENFSNAFKKDFDDLYNKCIGVGIEHLSNKIDLQWIDSWYSFSEIGDNHPFFTEYKLKKMGL